MSKASRLIEEYLDGRRPINEVGRRWGPTAPPNLPKPKRKLPTDLAYLVTSNQFRKTISATWQTDDEFLIVAKTPNQASFLMDAVENMGYDAEYKTDRSIAVYY